MTCEAWSGISQETKLVQSENTREKQCGEIKKKPYHCHETLSSYGHITDMQQPGARQGKFQIQGLGGIWGMETGGFRHQAHHRHSVFISQGCSNKVPQTWFGTTGVCFTVVEAVTSKSRCQAGPCSLLTCRQRLFLSFFLFASF